MRLPRERAKVSLSVRRSVVFLSALVIVVSVALPSSALADASNSSSASHGSDQYWSAIMNRSTLATMRHQEKFQPLVQELYTLVDRYPNSGFTSLAFEDDALAVYWKGLPPEAVQQAIITAQAKLPVHFRAARYSMTEMEILAAQISTLADGSDMQSVSLNYDGSGVRITRKTQSEVARAEAKLGRPLRHAEDILDEVRSRAATDRSSSVDSIPVTVTIADHPVQPLGCAGGVCTRLDDLSPWNGGDRIVNRDSPRGWYQCTSGFGVNQNGKYYLVTAGHCAHASGDRYYDAAGEYIGTSCGENSTLDIQVICAPGYFRMFDGTPWTSNYKLVLGWGYHVVNEYLCHSGATSGTVCNLKTIGGDYQVWGTDSDGDSFWFKGLIKAVQVDGATAGQPGDSGGPVFTLMGTGVRAKGTISAGGGSELLFQDWADYLRQWPNMYPRTP
jgi:streptogrisin D